MMFGKKKPLAGEIDVSDYDFLSKSLEFARLWAEPEAGMTAIIEPRHLGADPFLFGMALVDAARHGAKAYAHALNISEEDAMARIWEGLDAERANPTDDPLQIDLGGSTPS